MALSRRSLLPFHVHLLWSPGLSGIQTIKPDCLFPNFPVVPLHDCLGLELPDLAKWEVVMLIDMQRSRNQAVEYLLAQFILLDANFKESKWAPLLRVWPKSAIGYQSAPLPPSWQCLIRPSGRAVHIGKLEPLTGDTEAKWILGLKVLSSITAPQKTTHHWSYSYLLLVARRSCLE